jgi:hypothetical protein
MAESKNDDYSSRHHSRAVIWSALIGSIGVVVAALIGVSFGRDRGEDQRADLRKELEQRAAEVAELRKEIAGIRSAQEASSQGGTSRADQSSRSLREKTARRQGYSDQLADDGISSIKAPVPTTPTLVRTHVLDGTRVSLNSCAREAEVIRCIFYVENKADVDRHTFRLYTADENATMTSMIVDETGREYRATEASFGSDSIRNLGYLYRSELPSKTPIQGTLSFSGVPSDTSTIRLLRVTFGVEGFFSWNGLQHADFRNVAIAEEATATP